MEATADFGSSLQATGWQNIDATVEVIVKYSIVSTIVAQKETKLVHLTVTVMQLVCWSLLRLVWFVFLVRECPEEAFVVSVVVKLFEM